MKTLTKITFGLAATAAFLGMATPSEARMACGKRDSIIQQLKAKYGEVRRSFGVAQGNGVVELYANDETGTWTVLITNPHGTACLMAAGEAWQNDDGKTAGAPV